MGNRPVIFIGSSSEGLEVAKAIQANLDEYCEAILWTQGFFPLSKSTLEGLVTQLDEFDFAILVFTPDDSVESRGVTQQMSRDNVLIELGLFIGAIGRERTFMIFDRSANLKLPSDLAGVTVATFLPHQNGDYQAALGAACYQIEKIIKNLGRRRRLNSFINGRCHVEMYYHPDVFTRQHAFNLAIELTQFEIESKILEHDSENGPDAVFVGALVCADDARTVLRRVPYPIKYLFPPDYPESEGGDREGRKIGVGFDSTYNMGQRGVRATPIKLSEATLNNLLDARNSNTEFQCLLHRLAQKT